MLWPLSRTAMRSAGYSAGHTGMQAAAAPPRQGIIAPAGRLHGKMVSNLNEVKARGGQVIAIVTEGDEVVPGIVDKVMENKGDASDSDDDKKKKS